MLSADLDGVNERMEEMSSRKERHTLRCDDASEPVVLVFRTEMQ